MRVLVEATEHAVKFSGVSDEAVSSALRMPAYATMSTLQPAGECYGMLQGIVIVQSYVCT